MRKKTDQEVLDEVFAKLFGTEVAPKRRTRSKEPLDFILWEVEGKLYRNRDSALATGIKPKRTTMDAEFLLESWETEGYEPYIEDMTHEKYITIIRKKVAEYRKGGKE